MVFEAQKIAAAEAIWSGVISFGMERGFLDCGHRALKKFVGDFFACRLFEIGKGVIEIRLNMSAEPRFIGISHDQQIV